MMVEKMPLFPPGCGGSDFRLPLFDNGCGRNPCADCQTVRVRNPANPCETAEVELCVDAMGNLSICVRRPPLCCSRPPHGPRKFCGSRYD